MQPSQFHRRTPLLLLVLLVLLYNRTSLPARPPAALAVAAGHEAYNAELQEVRKFLQACLIPKQ